MISFHNFEISSSLSYNSPFVSLSCFFKFAVKWFSNFHLLSLSPRDPIVEMSFWLNNSFTISSFSASFLSTIFNCVFKSLFWSLYPLVCIFSFSASSYSYSFSSFTFLGRSLLISMFELSVLILSTFLIFHHPIWWALIGLFYPKSYESQKELPVDEASCLHRTQTFIPTDLAFASFDTADWQMAITHCSFLQSQVARHNC